MDSPTVAASEKVQVKGVSKTLMTPCRRIGLSRPSTGSLKKSLHTRTFSTPVQENKVVPSLHSENNALNHEHSLKEFDTPKRSFRSIDYTGLNNDVTPSKVRRSLSISSKKLVCTSSPSVEELKIGKYSKNIDPLLQNSGVVFDKLVNKRRLSEGNSTPCKSIGVDSENVDSSGTISPEITLPITASQSITDLDNIETEPQDITPEMIEELVLSIREKKKRLEQLQVRETYAKKHNVKEVQMQTAKWKAAGQEALRYTISMARQAGVSVTLQQLMTQHGFPPHLMDYNADDDEFD